MREDQADAMVGLLGDILTELQGLRGDFEKLTSYNTVSLQDAIEGITGPLGYSIGDLHTKLEDVHGVLGLIDVNTTQ